MLSVAVVTSTRGRKLIRKAAYSVDAQSYPAHHYVFAHGRDCRDAVEESTNGLPVTVVNLPAANGKNGYGMAPVFAAAPYLIDEDVVCFLDDDNWYEDDHIESVVKLIEAQNLGWAYSLRKIVDADGNYLCDDNCESLGLFPNSHQQLLVDNSCYVVRTDIARKFSHAWYVPVVSDRNFLNALKEAKVPCGSTGKHSVNYRLSKDGTGGMTAEKFFGNNEFMKQKYNGEFPWTTPGIFNFKEQR